MITKSFFEHFFLKMNRFNNFNSPTLLFKSKFIHSNSISQIEKNKKVLKKKNDFNQEKLDSLNLMSTKIKTFVVLMF